MRKGKRSTNRKRPFAPARVIGEAHFDADDLKVTASDPAHRFAKRRKSMPTAAERELLKRNFEFYKSLANGTRLAETIAQKHFAAMCRGELAPVTEHEIAFAKFIKIQAAKIKK